MHCNCESIEQLLNLVRKYTKDFELNEAVEQAVNECIHDNILSDFLRANKAEVISMSIFEYDKKGTVAKAYENLVEEVLNDERTKS